MNNAIKKIYEKHHQESREPGFSIMEKERGELLKNLIDAGKRILDIGCRDGTLTKYFAKDNFVLGVDIDQDSLTKAKERWGIETLLMDLNGDWGEIGNRKFDVVVAGEVLEHLYFPEEVIKKVVRHLNADGIFVGSVPNAFSLKHRFRYLRGRKKFTPLADPTHINQFSCRELENSLKKYFKEVKIVGLGKYAKLARIMPDYFAFIFMFVCRNFKE